MRKLVAALLVMGLIGVLAVAAMAAAPANPTLKSDTNAKFGTILTDARDMTVYTYSKDKPNQSNCTDADCLSAWPPVVATGQLSLAPGIPGTIGSITRPDNKVKQVTYNQQPLYYFTEDKKPGDVTGNGENGFAVVKLTSGTSGASPTANTTLLVRQDPKLGSFFTDAKGLALYIYKKDSPGKSVCNGTCAQNWPPLAASGTLTLPVGVSGKLGMITRDDGTKQVTYNDQPLYHFAGDKQPGDTNGQGIGGVWFVAAPASASGSSSAPAAAPTATSSPYNYGY